MFLDGLEPHAALQVELIERLNLITHPDVESITYLNPTLLIYCRSANALHFCQSRASDIAKRAKPLMGEVREVKPIYL